ncbi:MAG TPA: hypothetical protein ENH82_06910, partial [bacterium]|nr:hypothetical protein [bacterium]
MKYLNLPKDYNGVIPSMFMVKIEQPPEGCILSNYGLSNRYAHFWREEILKHVEHIKLPFSVGEPIGLRETYRYNWCDKFCTKIEYKADFNEADLRVFSDIHLYSRWLSSATMPEKAIRSWFMPLSFIRCSNPLFQSYTYALYDT